MQLRHQKPGVVTWKIKMHNYRSDVQITENVQVSRALWRLHGDRLHVPALFLEQAYLVLRDLVTISQDTRIRICTFRSKNTLAEWDNNNLCASVGLNHKRTMIKKLAHELVHAEQFHTGRLVFDGRHKLWQGEIVKNRGRTWQNYLALPWEREARSREDELTKVVYDCIDI